MEEQVAGWDTGCVCVCVCVCVYLCVCAVTRKLLCGNFDPGPKLPLKLFGPPRLKLPEILVRMWKFY